MFITLIFSISLSFTFNTSELSVLCFDSHHRLDPSTTFLWTFAELPLTPYTVNYKVQIKSSIYLYLCRPLKAIIYHPFYFGIRISYKHTWAFLGVAAFFIWGKSRAFITSMFGFYGMVSCDRFHTATTCFGAFPEYPIIPLAMNC